MPFGNMVPMQFFIARVVTAIEWVLRLGTEIMHSTDCAVRATLTSLSASESQGFSSLFH